MEKQILILKIGGKYNICDRMIFNLIQCGVQEGRKISDALDIFPYEYLAESLARLHNDGLIFLDVKMGASRLATKVQRLAEAQCLWQTPYYNNPDNSRRAPEYPPCAL